MYFNNAKCDIYIGTGAGKKLMEEIHTAQYSVKLVSPFLSPYLVKELIELHYKGIDVQLITMDTIEDFYGNRQKNMHRLIQQEVHIDDNVRRVYEQWRLIAKITKVVSIVMCVGFVLLNYILKDIRLLWLLIPISVCYAISLYSKSKATRKKVYSYSYSPLFPFKVVLLKDGSCFGNSYLHSKIYIIDDTVAYLGSLNFTGGGTRNNYETRVRLTDFNSVLEIVREFDALMNGNDMPERDVQEWGSVLYKEPIN